MGVLVHTTFAVGVICGVSSVSVLKGLNGAATLRWEIGAPRLPYALLRQGPGGAVGPRISVGEDCADQSVDYSVLSPRTNEALAIRQAGTPQKKIGALLDKKKDGGGIFPGPRGLSRTKLQACGPRWLKPSRQPSRQLLE